MPRLDNTDPQLHNIIAARAIEPYLVPTLINLKMTQAIFPRWMFVGIAMRDSSYLTSMKLTTLTMRTANIIVEGVDVN